MRTLALVVGALLVILGGYSLLGGSFSWTQEETVMEMGPIEATARTRDTAALPPVAAGLVLLVGVGVLVYGVRRGS